VAGCDPMRLRLDSGHSLAVGAGDDLNLQLNSGDLLMCLSGFRGPGTFTRDGMHSVMQYDRTMKRLISVFTRDTCISQ